MEAIERLTGYIEDKARVFCRRNDEKYFKERESGIPLISPEQMSPRVYKLYARHILMQYYCEYWGAWQYEQALSLAPTGIAKQIFSQMHKEEYGHARLVWFGGLGLKLRGPLVVMGIDPHLFRADSPANQIQILRIFQHSGFKRWSEIIIYNHFQDRSAAIQLRDFASGAFEVWRNVLQVIDSEEAEHIRHGEEWFAKIAETEEGREMLQEDINKWYPHAMDVFGHPGGTSRTEETLLKFGIKRKTNDQLREEFKADIMPLILKHNLTVPDWTHQANRLFA